MTHLLLSEAQLNLLFNSSKDYVYLLKRVKEDYIYIYTNPSAMNKLEGNVIGKKIREVLQFQHAKMIIKYYDLALESMEQQEFQDYWEVESHIRKCETTVIPIIEKNEQYILAFTKEIAVDRDVEDGYLFMRSAFFNSYLSTLLLSKNLELIEANPSFLKDIMDASNIKGEPFLSLPFIEQETKDELRGYLEEAKKGIHLSTKLITFVDRENKTRSFTATFTPLTENNEVNAIFIILQDVTKYIEHEQALRTTSHGLDVFKRAMDIAADLSITDISGKIISVNERFIQRTGFSRTELVGHTHNIVNSSYHPKEFFEDMWQTIQRGEVWRGEICNRTKYGDTYWNDTTIIPLRDVDGKLHQFIGVHFNVSDKKHIMTELRNIERTFRVITENTNDLIVITDEAGIISYASPSYVRILGYTEEELIGNFYSQLLAEECAVTWNRIFREGNKKENDCTIELMLKTKSGEILWTEGNYSIVRDLKHKQLIMVSREISERKELENKLMFMAYHDSLTNLPNRRYMQKEFPHLLEKANANFESIAIIYIDGDNFKEVNDMYGHDVGDEFIRQFSIALSKSIGIDDLVVRIGGDEFVMIITGLPRGQASKVHQISRFIQTVQRNLKVGWEINGHYFSPTSTMGIAFYPEHADSLEALLDLADKSLTESKLIAKNSYKIFNPLL
ncbi:diguanylate cyclase domain-containing protein [Lysinibacillus sp. 54212]|uniref:diguanylate cyclase domain-containing protein n=1 Tax=Lysinibacillus sp. 54212 TaxID=3119829 RepID=UPI002FCB0164